jgi:hypothetical protein
MKTRVLKSGIALGLFLAMIIGSVNANTNANEVVGTWNYEAPYAPYEYSKGKLVFTENGDKVEGKIKIGSYEIDMKNVKVEGNKVSFAAYVEGEYVSIKIEFEKKNFKGTASYSEGTIDVSGTKE